MHCLSRIALMLGISLTITPSTLNAQVQLTPLEREYQSLQNGVVELPLSFVNTSRQETHITGHWRWISHQQACVAEGQLTSTNLDANATQTLNLKLPAGTSTHYKLQLDWQAGKQSQQDVLDMITDAPQAQRPRWLLDGTWEHATTTGFWPFDPAHRADVPSMPGDDLKYKQVMLPDNVGATSKKDGVIHWYRRTLQLPTWLKGDAYDLIFQGIGKRAHVWLNGQHIAYLEGAWTTYTLDVSGALKPGQDNQLLIACADHTAQKQDPSRGSKFNWPIGHSGNAFAGVYDHFWLQARARIYTSNWQWQFDHANQSLQIKALVINQSNQALSKNTVFQVQLLDSDQLAYTAQTPVTIPAGGEQLVMIKMPVPDAKRWWPTITDAPGSPFLYGIKLNILSDDQCVDQIHDRIGLRQLAVKKGLYNINDIPIHPVARGMGGWTGAWSWRHARETCTPEHGNMSRIHCNPVTHNVVEAAEELGHLIQIETPLTASGYGYPLDDPDFWENFRTQTKLIIDDYRNNAAVISMSLSNEVFLCGAERYPKALDQMAAIVRFATSMTPDWPVLVNGDGDLRGRIDTANLHYPRHLSRHPLLPMDAYWLTQDQTLQLDLYPGSFTWKKDQLLEIGEDQWSGFSAWPHGCAITQGDAVYGDESAALLGHDAAAIQYMIGYRDSGVAYHQPWAKTSQASRAYAFQPIAAYLVDQYQTTQPGTTMRWQVNVFNDTMKAHTLKLRAVSDHFDVTCEQLIKLTPAQNERVTLSIPIPTTLNEQNINWLLTLTDETGTVRFTDQHTLRVRRPATLKQPTQALLVFPGDGRLVNSLKKQGLSYQLIKQFEVLGAMDKGLLLIGADASLSAMNATDRRHLADFAQRGGHVMIFEQSQYPSWPIVPARLQQDAGHDATIAHVMMPTHPLMTGLESSDFQYWPDGHIVSRRDLYKPDTDGAVALLATGGRIGLAWSPLMYLPTGKGWFVLSQLDLLKHWNTHPTPSRLFANVLKFADQSEPGITRKLYVLGDGASIKTHMDRVGIKLNPITDPNMLSSIGDDWLLIPDQTWDASWTQPVLSYIQQGGKVWLMDWESDGFKKLDEICHISPVQRDMPDYQLTQKQTHPYTSAISGYDGFWAQTTQGDPTPLANIARYSLVDYDPQSTARIELQQMTQQNAGVNNGLSTWGVPEGYARVYNFKSQKQTLQWTVPKEMAGTYYIGLTGRVSHHIPRKARQLSVAFVTEPFKWNMAGSYQLSVNDQTFELSNRGDSVQVPVIANDWAMPYGCMVSLAPVTLKAGDVVTIRVKKDGELWVAGLDLFKPRTNGQIVRLTNPGALSLVQYDKGQVLLDGINWQDGFEKVNRLATMMLNDLATGMGVAFEPYQSMMQSDLVRCQLLADDAVLSQEDGLPTLHSDGTRNMHVPFHSAVALREPGQWGTWELPQTLPRGQYQMRVIARVSNTSPKNIDLGKNYVLKVNEKMMPLVFDRNIAQPFVSLQANGWAIVYGTLRNESPLTLQAGDNISVGLSSKATGFVAAVQLVPSDMLAVTMPIEVTGGLPLKLNRKIDVTWPMVQQTLSFENAIGLCKEHPQLTVPVGDKLIKQLHLMQTFYHPWTDFAGQSADKPVARVTVTYTDGQTREFDVLYYQHVTMPLDAQANLPQAHLVWKNKQPFVDFLDDLTDMKGRWIQMEHPTPIYTMHWDNPLPDTPVKQVQMKLLNSGVLVVFAARRSEP